jgi:hypothetical protein
MKVNHMDIMHTNSDITFNDRVEHFRIRGAGEHWGAWPYALETRIESPFVAMNSPLS